MLKNNFQSSTKNTKIIDLSDDSVLSADINTTDYKFISINFLDDDMYLYENKSYPLEQLDL